MTKRYFVRRASRVLWCSCILLISVGVASCALAQPASGASAEQRSTAPTPQASPEPAKPISQEPTQVWSIPSDDELRAFLAKRMEHNGVGVVIGVIEPAGRRIVAYGRSGNPDAPLDGETIFLLGSVSKTFVGLVLADMIGRGEVKLDDPASKFLPPGVKMPQRGRPITLADLSTHTSGLPSLPTNINMMAEPHPIEAYTVQDLYRFLSTYTPSREPGVPEYSNLGVSLLGRLLGLRAGKEYKTLLEQRVLQPLGMDSTAIQLSPQQLKRLALGHDKDLQPTYTAEMKTLYPSGSLRSSANDLLKYLAANLGYIDTSLKDAMLYQRTAVRIRRGSDPSEVALGWIVRRVRGHEIFYHEGGKQGYRSVIAFDPERRLGVVVLSNARSDESMPAWSRYLLTGEPLPPPPAPYPVKKFLSIDPFTLDSYAGEYRMAKEGRAVNVVRRRDYLLVDDGSGYPAEMFAETLQDFGTRVERLQISFHTDVDGKVTGLTWYPRGKAAGQFEEATRLR